MMITHNACSTIVFCCLLQLILPASIEKVVYFHGAIKTKQRNQPVTEIISWKYIHFFPPSLPPRYPQWLRELMCGRNHSPASTVVLKLSLVELHGEVGSLEVQCYHLATSIPKDLGTRGMESQERGTVQDPKPLV